MSWVTCDYSRQVFNSSYMSNVQDSPLSRLLCIQYDNQPFQGDFYRQDTSTSLRRATFDAALASYNVRQYVPSLS